MTQAPRYDPTGRVGITQIVDGLRHVLVFPTPVYGGPGPLSDMGERQLATEWGMAIEDLIDRWADDYQSGRMAVERALAEGREAVELQKLAAELADDPRSLELLREVLRRLGAGDESASLAVANTLIDARDESGAIVESAADVADRLGEALEEFGRKAADVVATIYKVGIAAVGAWGLSRLIRART